LIATASDKLIVDRSAPSFKLSRKTAGRKTSYETGNSHEVRVDHVVLGHVAAKCRPPVISRRLSTGHLSRSRVGVDGRDMNSYFVNPPYCYRGAVVDRTGGHCLTSPADQLHASSIDYQPSHLLRAHYDDIYGYAGGYVAYSTASEKGGQQNGSIGGYYGELDTTGHHLGSFSTSGGGQQLTLMDATSGIAFQSRNSAQSPLPTPVDFCRPYLPSDGVGYQPAVSRQTGSGNGTHLVTPFASTAAEAHTVPTTQNKQPEHGTTSGSGLGRRHIDGSRSDCSRSPSGSSSRSSSPGGASAEPGQAADCRALSGEVDSGGASENGGTGGNSTFSAHTSSSSSQTTTTTCQYQQQIYPWMRRIHLANGTIANL